MEHELSALRGRPRLRKEDAMPTRSLRTRHDNIQMTMMSLKAPAWSAARLSVGVDREQLLADVLALEQPAKRGWNVVETMLHVDDSLQLTLRNQFRERFDRLAVPCRVIQHNEAFHASPAAGQHQIVTDALCRIRINGVVAGNPSALDDTRAQRNVLQRSLQNFAADVFEDDVDTFRSELADALRHMRAQSIRGRMAHAGLYLPARHGSRIFAPSA
jgi:hypothetical protein